MTSPGNQHVPTVSAHLSSLNAQNDSPGEAPVAAVFVDFPKNKCNSLHKNKLDIVRRVQFLTGRRPMSSFLLGQSPPLPNASWRLYTG